MLYARPFHLDLFTGVNQMPYSEADNISSTTSRRDIPSDTTQTLGSPPIGGEAGHEAAAKAAMKPHRFQVRLTSYRYLNWSLLQGASSTYIQGSITRRKSAVLYWKELLRETTQCSASSKSYKHSVIN